MTANRDRCECILCRPPRWLLAAAVLCIAACIPPAPELPVHEQRAVQAALAGWAAAGLPAPDDGRCDFGHVYVRVEALESGCPTPVSSQLHDGCLDWESSGHWFRPRQYPVVVIDPTFPAQHWPALVVHECLHAALSCSGMSASGPGNMQHTDRRVWSRAYQPGEDAGASAESRANALLLRRLE